MIELFLFLLFAHALADFPLQGDYLSKAKNRYSPLPNNPPFWAMFWHCFIHAGFVYLLTGAWILAIAEFVLHWIADDLKCAGKIGFTIDQLAHIVMKGAWAWIALDVLRTTGPLFVR